MTIFFYLQNLTSRRSPVIYNIVNQRGKVAKLCIFKSVFRLGEDIIGFFDFSGSQVPCYQVCMLFYYLFS